MRFAVRRAEQPDGLRVTVAGEVDADTAPRLKAELLAAVRVSPSVVVDLSEVTFMDSQGLSALLRARTEAEARGGTLRLDRVPARVLKLFRITQLDSVFAIEPSAAES